MLKIINSSNNTFWLYLIGFSLSLELAALYYQYYLGFEPCVLCIQIRLLFALFMVICILGLLLKKLIAARYLLTSALVVICLSLIDKSWILIKTERGLMMGSCSFNAGLPAWLPIERMFPSVFEVRAACGTTPEIAFGISMSESLLVISTFLLFAVLASIAILIFEPKDTD